MHSSPLAAVATAKPSSSSTPVSDCRMPGSSSTMRTECAIFHPTITALPHLFLKTIILPHHCPYRLLRYRQLDNEPRAARRIILHTNAPLMFGDDATDDGQPQSRAAFACRKIR